MRDGFDRDDLAKFQAIIDFIAEHADSLATSAGVGALETAGSFVSYLHEHPEDLEPFINGGYRELPDNWRLEGALCWQGKDGLITPEDAKFFSAIKPQISDTAH